MAGYWVQLGHRPCRVQHLHNSRSNILLTSFGGREAVGLYLLKPNKLQIWWVATGGVAEATDAKSSRPWLGVASTWKVGMAETAAVPAGMPETAARCLRACPAPNLK